jgi:hypothetical protein
MRVSSAVRCVLAGIMSVQVAIMSVSVAVRSVSAEIMCVRLNIISVQTRIWHETSPLRSVSGEIIRVRIAPECARVAVKLARFLAESPSIRRQYVSIAPKLLQIGQRGCPFANDRHSTSSALSHGRAGAARLMV